MTEHDWISSANPEPLLGYLRGDLDHNQMPAEGLPERCSGRKIALFVLGVCERVRHAPMNKPTEQGIEILHRFAVDKLSIAELESSLSKLTVSVGQKVVHFVGQFG